VATISLVAANVAVYLAVTAQSGAALDGAGLYDSAIYRQLVLVPGRVAQQGEWLRLVGSGFLHLGLLHLAMNMLALWVLGRDVELFLGRWRFLALYGASLLGGSASVLWFSAYNTATAGASGAIFGLMGAEAVLLLRLRRNPNGALAVIGINLLFSVAVPGISLTAHLGGLAAGLAGAIALVYAPQWLRARSAAAASRIGWLGLGIVAAVTVALIILRANEIATQYAGHGIVFA
jgi:membrane associated rhomboid family serine protease